MGFIRRRREGSEEALTGRAAIGCDHGYDARFYYLGLAFDPRYVEEALERIGEDEPEVEDLLLRGRVKVR
jgi:hypothetical protein